MSESKPRGWQVKPNVDLPAGDVAGKVNLKYQDYDKLIDQQGVRVKVYRTILCPNVKSVDGGEHEIDCALCYGANFVDRLPICTVAFIQGQTLEKHQRPEGMVDGNSISATFKQGIELQYFTLVELLDFSDLFFERVKRSRGQVDVLRYPAVRVNLIVDETGAEFVEGLDFQLDENGSLRWCLNKGPVAGTIYSINYEMKVRFRAVSAQHVNRFAQIAVPGATKMVKLNEQWMLQKSFLVERKDSKGNPLTPNKIRDEDDDWI